MVYLVAVVARLAVRAAVGLVDTHRGHWRHGWAVSAIMGPFAVALAWERRNLEPPSLTVLTTGRTRRRPVDPLVGFDGSPSSLGGAAHPRLAWVLDVDTEAPNANVLDQAQPKGES